MTVVFLFFVFFCWVGRCYFCGGHPRWRRQLPCYACLRCAVVMHNTLIYSNVLPVPLAPPLPPCNLWLVAKSESLWNPLVSAATMARGHTYVSKREFCFLPNIATKCDAASVTSTQRPPPRPRLGGAPVRTLSLHRPTDCTPHRAAISKNQTPRRSPHATLHGMQERIPQQSRSAAGPPIQARLPIPSAAHSSGPTTESAFAKTPWTCKVIKLFSHDERYIGKSSTASRPAPLESARTSGRLEKRRRERRPWRRWWRSPA